MSPQITIVNHLTPAIVLTIEANIAAAKLISDPIVIAMTDSQTKRLIKVGPSRTAQMTAIYSKLLKPYSSTIPVAYTLADYDARKQELIDSLNMRDLYLAQANVYGTHAEIVAHDLFVMNVEGLDEGRLQMKSSTGIATAVNDISTEFFTHTAANGATVFSIGPSMTLQVNNLVTGKRIINDGITIITVLVVGGNAADKITIYPGDSVAIPKTWVNVVVTNVSATSTGSFQVFIN